MVWFTNLLRYCLNALQLGGAIAACVFYASTYGGVKKDYRWNFAITTSGFSISAAIIQPVLRRFRRGRLNYWTLLLGGLNGIIFFFWTGVLGTFAKSFIHLDASQNNGIRMMQIAVYIDAANMVIWFLAYMSSFAGGHHHAAHHHADLDMESMRFARRARRSGEGLDAHLRYEANLSTQFIPHGWDPEDIEAQTLAVQIENLPLHPTADETPTTHLPIPYSILPELPPPVVTARSGRNTTSSRDMEGGRPVSEIMHLLPEELQDSHPMPLVRAPNTLGWPLPQLQPSSAASGRSRRPGRPLNPRAHTDSTKRPARHSSHDLHDSLKTYNTSTVSEVPDSLSRKISQPLSVEWDEPTKECLICVEQHPCRTGFPSRISKACTSHEQRACRICIDRSIVAEMDSNIHGPIHCVECRAVLDYEEVKALASPTTFLRYERMGFRDFASSDPNFVWCQNPNCPSGQEHVGGVDQPIVTCQACGFRTCFKHQIPWHEEMLCDEYDERVRLSNDERQSRMQQELASIAAIHEATKPCANKACKAPIQKIKGCDHMKCARCKHEFCWVCGDDWGGRHRLGCGFS